MSDICCISLTEPYICFYRHTGTSEYGGTRHAEGTQQLARTLIYSLICFSDSDCVYSHSYPKNYEL